MGQKFFFFFLGTKRNHEIVLWLLSTTGKTPNQIVTFAVGILYLTCIQQPTDFSHGNTELEKEDKRGRKERKQTSIALGKTYI